jgi:hypothetical protein
MCGIPPPPPLVICYHCIYLTSALAKASMSNALAPNAGENAINDAAAKAAFLNTARLESITLLSESVVIASWVAMADLLFELTGVIVNAEHEVDDRNKKRHTFRKEVMLNYTVFNR